jgi:hypothetical protein
LHPERELQAFMIKPIQRITKYGLLLDVGDFDQSFATALTDRQFCILPPSTNTHSDPNLKKAQQLFAA